MSAFGIDFGRITGKPHLTGRWPFGRVTEGLPTTRDLLNVQVEFAVPVL